DGDKVPQEPLGIDGRRVVVTAATEINHRHFCGGTGEGRCAIAGAPVLFRGHVTSKQDQDVSCSAGARSADGHELLDCSSDHIGGVNTDVGDGAVVNREVA